MEILLCRQTSGVHAFNNVNNTFGNALELLFTEIKLLYQRPEEDDITETKSQ